MKCQEAIKNADEVIKKQDNLIDFMRIQNEGLFTEKTQMQMMLEEKQQEIETSQRKNVWIAILSAAAGAGLTAVLIKK